MAGMMRRSAIFAALTGAAFGLAACDGVGVGISYGYDDALFWNHYYHHDHRPDRPVRPDPPGQAVPPIATAPRPVPPIATVPRPTPRIATPPAIRPPLARPVVAR
ncbi:MULTISPECIES: hypothetical protein [unclassified Rhodosalinus]|uniref:hypothetical protein n=1 Tax=unclassified Rhodosalinus TaxID=2630183 RepID=UPI003526B611